MPNVRDKPWKSVAPCGKPGISGESPKIRPLRLPTITIGDRGSYRREGFLCRPLTSDLELARRAMRERILGISFCLSVWFAACVQDQAVAQPFLPLDDPALGTDASQAGCPIRYTLRHFAGQRPATRPA